MKKCCKNQEKLKFKKFMEIVELKKMICYLKNTVQNANAVILQALSLTKIVKISYNKITNI